MIKVLTALLTLAASGAAQQHEMGLTLGGAASPIRRKQAPGLELRAGRTLQANYGYRLRESRHWALFGEVHFLASPLREVRSAGLSVTRDVASLYLTPGIRVRLRPRSRISPHGSIGVGWALYEQSLLTRGGTSNTAPRLAHRAALQFGAGLDIRIWRLFAFRTEVRDFYTGNPVFNLPVRGGQHNVAPAAGLVLRFGE